MAYPQRTDLNSPAEKIARQVAKGQTYGQATQQLEAQRTVPMGASPSDVAANRQVRQAPIPGSLGDLARPTERPNEPITMFSPEQPALLQQRDSVIQELQILNEMYPNEDLAALLSAVQYEGR